MLKVFEAFSGYGSQSLALERLNIPHKVVCISEIDKYAIQAYEALHGKVLNLGDISKIEVGNIPNHDLFTYSFPCQDISVAGNQKGLIEGQTRSGLLWECERIIEAKRPKYLLMENVKNLVSKKFMPDFLKWKNKLEQLGYTNYCQVLNAKDFGIPQNRERVFIISILGDHKPFERPKEFDNGLRLKDFLEDEVDEKFYIAKEKTEKLIMKLKDKTIVGNVNPSARGINGNIYNSEKLSPTLTTNKGEGIKVMSCLTLDRINKRQNGRRFKEDGEPMFTLTGQDRHGILIKEATVKGYCEAFPGDYVNVGYPNSDTRRGRVGHGIANTILTGCDHAAVMQVGNYREKETGFTNPQTGRVYSPQGLSPTLNTMQGGDRQPKILCIDDTQGFDGARTYEDNIPCLRSQRSGLKVLNVSQEILNKYAVECDGFYYIIRKITPRECFRLMGLKDFEIDKIQAAGISNSQQYKLAGNSIVVDVLEAIFKQLFLK